MISWLKELLNNIMQDDDFIFEINKISKLKEEWKKSELIQNQAIISI